MGSDVEKSHQDVSQQPGEKLAKQDVTSLGFDPNEPVGREIASKEVGGSLEAASPREKVGAEGITESRAERGLQASPNPAGIPSWLDKLASKFSEVMDHYATPYRERLCYVPKNHVIWDSDTPGEGYARPVMDDERSTNVAKELARYEEPGIKYVRGFADFSKVSEANVKIDSMTNRRYENFKQADEACAKLWSKEGREDKTDWKARDVENWRHENHYEWHECQDLKTCNLVSHSLHSFYRHCGGVLEYKSQNGIAD